MQTKEQRLPIAKFNFLNFILKAHLSTFMGVFTDNFITSYHYSNSHFYITSWAEYIYMYVYSIWHSCMGASRLATREHATCASNMTTTTTADVCVSCA